MFRRLLIYFAVLRPSFLIALVIVYLPLTAAADGVPGNLMLANLFVDYDFAKAFWFAFALSGAVWALMLTTCLTLDFARDRQEQQGSKQPWIPDPGQKNRWVTIPICHKQVFWLFTSLAAPAAVIVVLRATSASLISLAALPARASALLGLAVGGLLSYMLMNLVGAFVLAENDDYQVLPWRPMDWMANRLKRFRAAQPVLEWLGHWVGRLAKATRRGVSALLAGVAPGEIFEDGTRLLKPDHFYAAISAVAVVIIYGFIYWLFKPTGPWRWPLEELPPAGFIFALFLPLIWIVSALWAWLGRYRLAFYLAVGLSFVLSLLASRLSNPAHTYDVVGAGHLPLEPQSILQPLADGKRKNLIIVAASGGGILAAGWTAQVLTELHAAYADFPKELRLISAVSGGSVGAAHYVNSVSDIMQMTGDRQKVALRQVAEDAMRSSLAATSYGFAFPDFKRAIFPFIVDEEFDRARLLETDWRRIANCRKQAARAAALTADFREFCRALPEDEQNRMVWLSQWRVDMETGLKPAVIFNATVMETGERIAITPLSSSERDWPGRSPQPPRHDRAQTLSRFLSAKQQRAEKKDSTKMGGGAKKNATCAGSQYRNGYDIDVWTAARLSATFSYVSPAARAACWDSQRKTRSLPAEKSHGQLHLIDGGYHDNYGVASALDWLSALMEAYDKEPLPVTRIALIEIRASPDIPEETPENEWSSAWLGPFWGLFNSWGSAQMSSNDTAVSQLVSPLKQLLEESRSGIRFDSFVFIPRERGPLSWHLSEAQKNELRLGWKSNDNQEALKDLLDFLNGGPNETPLK
jgi:hypothetical protein